MRSMGADIFFIVVGLIALLLLFMPVEYMGCRYAGYASGSLFLVWLVVREVSRKRDKTRKNGNRQEQDPFLQGSAGSDENMEI